MPLKLDRLKGGGLNLRLGNSTFTGETVSMDDVVVEDDAKITAKGGIAAAANKVVSSKTYKVSYAKLAKLCGSASSNITIASAIITCVATASGVTIATTAVVVVTLIEGWV